MAVISPDHLLDQAESLVVAGRVGALRQTDIRRSYSAAYYALFHFVLTAAADEAIGRKARTTPQWTLAYRSVSHRWLGELCSNIIKQNLPARLEPYKPNAGFGTRIEGFSRVLIDLQDKRLLADYDPSYAPLRSDAEASILTARTAITRFQSAGRAQQKAFLFLVLFPPRNPGSA